MSSRDHRWGSNDLCLGEVGQRSGGRREAPPHAGGATQTVTTQRSERADISAGKKIDRPVTASFTRSAKKTTAQNPHVTVEKPVRSRAFSAFRDRKSVV